MKETSIKIIPKPKARAPVKNFALLLIAFIIFAVPSATFVMIKYYLNPQAVSKGSNLERELMSLDNRDNLNLKNEIIRISNKISDYEFLSKQHQATSRIFSFIGSICHKKVQITGLKFSAPTMLITCDALTDRFRTFGEQVLSLRDNANVKGLTVKGAALNDKGISFGFDINVADSLFDQVVEEEVQP